MGQVLKEFGYFIFAFLISYIAFKASMGVANAIVKADEIELKMQRVISIIVSFLSAILSVYLFFNS